jgi:EmrB/QacA subfamily drug resistance transporter
LRVSQSAPGSRKGLALALLAAAQFIVILDASIVNVALPSIGRDLDFSQEDLSWVVNAYTLVFGGFLLLGGRMADLLGRRRVFTVGLVLFALASLLGGLSASEGQLIAARALQGLGAAILSPAALAILTTTFAEGAERNRALGVWGAVAGSGGAVGVLLGGVLTEYLGWEWVLFVNVPVALAAAALTGRLLAESREAGVRRYDVAGAVSITAGISLLVYALVDAVNVGWGDQQTLGLIAISLALVAAFVAIELRSSHPLISFAIFRKRTLTGANVVAVLVAMSLFSMFFFVSLYMQQVLGYDALKAGVAYLPLAGGIIISAGLASQLVTKVGFKPVMVAGFLLVAAGLVWFAQVSPGGTYVGDVLFPSLLAAVGLGLVFVPLTIAAVAGVSAEESGLASGLINTSQQVGGALGLAILATIANSTTQDAMTAAGGAKYALPAALTEGFQDAFTVGAGFAILGAILTVVLISSRTSREHAEAARRGEVEVVPVAA